MLVNYKEGVMAATIHKQSIQGVGFQGSLVGESGSFLRILRRINEFSAEWLWCLLSLVLFMALGPFSAPIAIIAILKLGFQEPPENMPESL